MALGPFRGEVAVSVEEPEEVLVAEEMELRVLTESDLAFKAARVSGTGLTGFLLCPVLAIFFCGVATELGVGATELEAEFLASP